MSDMVGADSVTGQSWILLANILALCSVRDYVLRADKD